MRFWVHKATGVIYRLITVARCSNNPTQFSIVYDSTRPSVIRGTDIYLPAGTRWVRSSKEFFEKFQPLKK